MICMCLVDRNIKHIFTTLEHAGFECFLVGGAVRDLLLNKPPTDFDFATNARPGMVMKLFDKVIPTGVSHGTVTVVIENKCFEITTYRRDINCDGRHCDVVFSDNIKEDLSRRDFKINAMAMNSKMILIDMFGGEEDIKYGWIDTVGDPKLRFDEDKLRIVRAVRLATVLDFKIKKRVLDEIQTQNLARISNERIRNEFVKILMSEYNIRGFELLDKTGLLYKIIPEIEAMKNLKAGSHKYHPEKDIYEHTLIALSSLPKEASLELRLATLLHDVGKPPTWDNYHFSGHEVVGCKMANEILKRLKFQKSVVSNVSWLVANHMIIHRFDELRNAKKIRLIQEPLFYELLELLKADSMVKTTLPTKILEYINSCTHAEIKGTNERLITGHDVMALGIPPGPIISKIITKVENLQLDRIITSRTEAIEYIKTMNCG